MNASTDATVVSSLWVDEFNVGSNATRVSVETWWNRELCAHVTYASWDDQRHMVAYNPGSYDARVAHIHWSDAVELLLLMRKLG